MPCSPLKNYFFFFHHSSTLTTLGLYGSQTLNLLDTSAVLYQVNCVYKKPTQSSAPGLLVGSIGRTLYQHRRGQGYKSTVQACIFSGFPLATAKIASITAMIFFHLILHPAVPVHDYHFNYIILFLHRMDSTLLHVIPVLIIHKPVH